MHNYNYYSNYIIKIDIFEIYKVVFNLFKTHISQGHNIIISLMIYNVMVIIIIYFYRIIFY